MTPHVSIIITCYNYAEFVDHAINSALNQTYKNIEVIVVNDGSNDNSEEVIKKYISKIKYLPQNNQGVVVARNNGAKLAKGELIVFLDADDYLPENFISKSVESLNHHPEASFVFGNQQVVGKREFLIRSRPWSRYYLLISNYIGVTTVMRKSAFYNIGGFDYAFNKIKSYEDWDLWLSLLSKGEHGAYDPSIFFYYRKQHENNRNKASAWQKVKLRLPLLQKHWRLYISTKFLIRLPSITLKSLRFKISVMRQNNY